MNNREMAVAVAKDVLYNLEKDYISAYSGVYFRLKKQFNLSDKDKQLQDYFTSPDKRCLVCALGAAFVSSVKLYNDVTIGEASYIDNDQLQLSPSSGFIKRNLSKIFSDQQIEMIESAFEKANMSKEDPMLAHIAESISFGEKYQDATVCMHAIMQNIVDNNGEFVPNAND